jgi:predicted PurR-regulated permease PerM
VSGEDDTVGPRVPFEPMEVIEPAGNATTVASSASVVDAATAAPSRMIWTSLNHPFAAGLFWTLGALVALVFGLAVSNLSAVLISIAFAVFAALGLDPVVRALERRGVARTWGIVIVFSGFAVALVAVLWAVLPTVVRQVGQFVDDIPDMVADFEQSDIFDWLQVTFGDEIGNLINETERFLIDPGNLAAIGGGVLQVGASIAAGISGTIIVLVLSLYFLASLPDIKKNFTQLVPARNRTGVATITDQITDSIGGYLMGMVVLAFCNSMVALILHLVLGLPFPALMAVIAFCITLIPLVGPVLYWVIASTLAVFSDPLAALIFALIYLIYMQLEAYVLTPRIMNRTISIPGSLVVIGALVGGTLLGLLGALVAIPVTASILLIIKQVLIPRQNAKV